MQINRKGMLVRWAYLWCGVPNQTDICALFWRTVLLTPLTLLAAVLIAGTTLVTLGVVPYLLFQDGGWIGLLYIPVVIVIPWGIMLMRYAATKTEAGLVIRQGIKGFRSQYCAVIRLK